MTAAFHYFAYGSNMSSARLSARVGPLGRGARATLRGYRHRFNKLGNDGSAKGNLIEAAGLSMGVLYQVSQRQFEILREVESGYGSADVVVDLGSSRCEAVTFFAEVLSETVTPHREYLDHYVIGAREHAIPVTYLDEILPRWYRLKK